jgi:hypothetical protein
LAATAKNFGWTDPETTWWALALTGLSFAGLWAFTNRRCQIAPCDFGLYEDNLKPYDQSLWISALGAGLGFALVNWTLPGENPTADLVVMVVGTWAVTAIAAFTIEKIVRNPAREWAKEQLEKELLHK